MAALTQTDIDILVQKMNDRYQPKTGVCVATPAQMDNLLKRLNAYTKQVQDAAEDEGLDKDTNVAQWALDMASWQQRIAHYKQELLLIPKSDWDTETGCEAIYETVTSPLLDGVYYEVLPGIVLSPQEKVDILAGGQSNPKPNDVISPFTLGNQVLVYKQHQKERADQFWKDLEASAKRLKKAIAEAGKLALPWGILLLGAAAVVAVGYLIVKTRSPIASTRKELQRIEADAEKAASAAEKDLGKARSEVA